MKQLFLVLALLSPSLLHAQLLSDFQLQKYQYCGSDSDCVYAINGCCDCVNGGQNVAINKNRLADFKAQFSCERVGCTRIAAEQPCGSSGVVSCVHHRCKYFTAEEYQQLKEGLER